MALSSWYYWLRGTPLRRSATEAGGVVAVGLAVLALGLGAVMVTPWPGPQISPWWHAPPLILAGVVMLAKRHHPVGSLLAALPLLAIDAWLGGSIGMVLVLIDLIYSTALHAGSTALRRLGIVIAVVTASGTAVAFILFGNIQVTVLMFIQFFAIMATPLWWGVSVRRHTELAALASARAEDLQRLTDLREADAIRSERTRMARDLHDALSSNLSTIAIHAEAALNQPAVPAGASGDAPGTGGSAPGAGGDAPGADAPGSAQAGDTEKPSREHRALSAIRAASLTALEEMRTMVLLLRTGEDEITAPQRAADLTPLISEARRTGLQVELTDTAPDRAELPTAVGHAAYRIVQEALTNAVKHAPGGRASVHLGADREALCVQVESTMATGAPKPTTTPSPGLGLVHMRERAQALGGTLHAGWTEGPQPCWRIRATLPTAQVGR